MKKILSIVTSLVLCACLLLPMQAYAAAPTAKLTGPGTVRAGDTITVTLKVKGDQVTGFEGTLSYDASQVTYVSSKLLIGSGWSGEYNTDTKRVMIADENVAAPVSSETALFSFTFKVNSSLSTGTKVKIALKEGSMAYEGLSFSSYDVPGEIAYNATIAQPLSTDNTLKSLTVSNATISPVFRDSTVSYTAIVPFSVSKLDVKAEANDSKAKVSISSPSLSVGSNNAVTVTVTAENGVKKTYTIKVTRQQDPNYVASGENKLASLKVDGYVISPGFDADKTEYIVWLPYETEKVSASGTPKDSKASVRVEGGDKLEAGKDNEIKVICVAENGTEKVYTIIAKRAAAHGSEDTPGTDTPGTDTPGTDDPGTDEPDDKPDDKPVETPSVSHKECISFWWLIPALLLGVALGVSGTIYYYEKDKEE